MKERIYWIDYLKAFAMFLVVLGHAGLGEDSIIKSWIYGFHMPLFIFVSGYCIGNPKPVGVELKKDFKTLVVPYVFFSIFLIPFYYVIQRLSGIAISESFPTYILSRLLMDDYYHCGPIWFLGALMVIKLSYNSMSAILHNGGGGIWDYTLIGAITLIIVTDILGDVHVLSADSALSLFPYYVAGTMCSKLIEKCKPKLIFVSGIIGMALYTVISVYNIGIDYDQLKLGNNAIITYAEGLLGCFSITFLFSLLANRKNELIRSVGMNTLTILGLHTIFIQVFRFAYKTVVSDMLPLWYLVMLSVCAFVLSYLLSLLLVSKCPVVIGRKRD